MSVHSARTLKTFKIDVCSASETWIKNPISVITHRRPDATSFFRPTLFVSGDRVSSASGQVSVVTALSMRAECAL